ncbi:hypothetical protein V6Z11_A08G084700 [Gossypium hirsutum]
MQNVLRKGLIVCDRQKIKGEQGVNLDALVGIVTRLARQMEEIGIANTYSLAERVAAVIQDAKPLLTKIEAMAEDVQPLLSELRDSGLLQEVENLTRSLTQASEDLRTHLSRMGRRWHQCFILIAAVSKHFLRGYVGIHSSGFRNFLLKPELLRSIVDSGFEHPSEGKVLNSLKGEEKALECSVTWGRKLKVSSW